MNVHNILHRKVRTSAFLIGIGPKKSTKNHPALDMLDVFLLNVTTEKKLYYIVLQLRLTSFPVLFNDITSKNSKSL